MSQIPQADLTGLVLAGGQSRRWNGVDKAWVRLANRPLVAHVAERLASQTGVVWINANRDLDRYAALGPPVFTDDWPDALGPLAGIASALRRIETHWLLVAPVDGPRRSAAGALRSRGTRRRSCRRLRRGARPRGGDS